MKKVLPGNVSEYNKQSGQFHRDQNMDYNSNSFQWPPTDPINQNKQNSPSEAVFSYPAGIRELPQIDQEEMLSWYRTVPLSHDPQDYDARETMQELQLNRKERLLTERQKRFRTSFTTCQLGRLEEEFEQDKYAVGMKRMRLARELGLTEKQIKVWYQNRRMKYKRVCQRIHNKRMAAVNSYW
ncbi:ventral anterior homeobox 2b-like [Dendronephthya gigantea]|uniref:ventral anterior homeobox 2b-like n=1 Tax=Dendronephthya gigantea TaxID=151771 RepID=UPI0010696D59|nr:ventral anterior homeobox 2b-like [Dendronephthya gigantea]